MTPYKTVSDLSIIEDLFPGSKIFHTVTGSVFKKNMKLIVEDTYAVAYKCLEEKGWKRARRSGLYDAIGRLYIKICLLLNLSSLKGTIGFRCRPDALSILLSRITAKYMVKYLRK